MTDDSQRRPLHALVVVAGASIVLAASMASSAAEPASPFARLSAGLQTCAELRVDAERLACFDRFVAPQVRGAAEAPAAAASAPAESRSRVAASDAVSFLDEFWELTPDRKRGVFNFTGYRPNYFFPVHVTNHVNRSPVSPAPGHSGPLPDHRDVEAKLQLSVRTKLAEGLLLPGADLWFAYTQQSLWQLYSGAISRPFRATDHEPEIFYIVPTPVDLPFGLKLKMAGFGLAHQSNGQTLPFSRSWNRWYALGGIEREEFALTARFNTRIRERDGHDDNPDFTDYRGRSELLGIWMPGRLHLERALEDQLRQPSRLAAARLDDARQPQGPEGAALVRAGLHGLR